MSYLPFGKSLVLEIPLTDVYTANVTYLLQSAFLAVPFMVILCMDIGVLLHYLL